MTDNYKFWIKKGFELNESNSYSDAIDSFQKAIKLAPHKKASISKLIYKKGGKMFGLRNYQGGLEIFNQGTVLFPEDARFWYMKGIMHHHLRQCEEGLLSFEKALELNPKHKMALRFRNDVKRKSEPKRRLLLLEPKRGLPLYEVMLISNDPPTIGMLKTYFKENIFGFYDVSSCSHALETLEIRIPFLILVDNALPEENRNEFLTMVKTIKKLQDISIKVFDKSEYDLRRTNRKKRGYEDQNGDIVDFFKF